jgi:hypothetical protein
MRTSPASSRTVAVAAETLADEVRRDQAPPDAATATVRLDAGEVRIALRRAGGPA